MKKIMQKIAILVSIILVFQIITTIVKTKQETTYFIKDKNERSKIVEKMNIVDHQSVYTFEITHQKKTYHFQINQNYHKQNKVIKDIITYQEDNLFCLYPILKGNKKSTIHCYEENQEKSLDTIQQKEKVIAFYKNKKIDLTTKAKAKKYKDILYYPTSFNNHHLLLWNYHQLYNLSKKKQNIISLLDQDQYENNYSILIKNIYLVINTDQDHDFDEFYLVDIKKQTKKTWKIPYKISKDCYFLGVVEEKVYLFDKDNLVEYELNLATKKIKIIGDKNQNGKLYQNGTWKKINIYDLKQETSFSTTKENQSIRKKYPNATIYTGKNKDYFIKDKKLYMTYHNVKDSEILLLDNYELKEVKIVDDIIYFIDNDTIYCYDDINGLQPILTSKELKYNSKNIYAIA